MKHKTLAASLQELQCHIGEIKAVIDIKIIKALNKVYHFLEWVAQKTL